VIWLLYRVRGILLPFVLGAIIAYLLNPGITRLERRGWPRSRAVALAFGAFLAVFVGAIVLLVPVLVEQARDLITHYDQYAFSAQRFILAIHGKVELLPQNAQNVLGDIGKKIEIYGRMLLDSIPAILNRSIALVSLLIITPIATYWLLRDYKRLGGKLLCVLPEPRRTTAVEVLGEINKLVGSYLLGMAIMVVIVGIYSSVVLAVAGAKFAVLLGIMTGVLYLIPYVGFPAAMVIIALTMVVTQHTIGGIFVVVGVLIVGNIASDYIVTPRVVGGRVGLHPLVVIFALLAGATLLGVLGMLLAVPTAGAIKVVLLRFWPELFTPESATTHAAAGAESSSALFPEGCPPDADQPGAELE
jgi:predicted PurR-regulated permease PerM